MPTDLRITPARLDLLRDVEAGEVWRNTNGHTTTPGVIGVDSEPLIVVTARIAEMEDAGWVLLVERAYGSKQWQLTAAGRELLAAHTKTEG